jgi:UDP-N-acetylglucosamine 2-epimerase
MENLAEKALRSDPCWSVTSCGIPPLVESQSKLSVTQILARYEVTPNEFALATTHRAIIRERGELLREVLEALREMPIPVLLPLHPSTRSAIKDHHLEALIEPGTNLRVMPPVKYRNDRPLSNRIVLSDSGGLIKSPSRNLRHP